MKPTVKPMIERPIDESLRRAYAAPAHMPLPRDLADLLDRLARKRPQPGAASPGQDR